MNPVRVLIISHAFPPQAEVGSIRIAQFCRYLPEYGIEPVVLTVEERFYEAVDYSRMAPPSVRVLRTPMITTPLEWYRTAKRLLHPLVRQAHSLPENQKTTRSGSSWREAILGLLQIPDRYWGWYLPAIRYADRFLREEHVDAIFSSGPPWTSHLIARHVKLKFNIPWLVDFRDPWASLVPHRHAPAWQHRLTLSLEKSCVRSADLVLCNTERLCHTFQTRYSEFNSSKFRTLTNGFEDLPVMRKERRGSKHVLLHLGSIYGQRRIDTFLVALSELVRSGRLDAESFQVIFQGDAELVHLAEAAKIVPDLLQSKCIEFRPRVSWSQAWPLLWQSDLLLLFQGTHELQVPAKFYEYLQTGIPIFAVTEEGALTDILQATKSGIWVKPGDPQGVAEALLKALQMPKRSQEDISKQLAGRYHYRFLARQLGLWIRELSNAAY